MVLISNYFILFLKFPFKKKKKSCDSTVFISENRASLVAQLVKNLPAIQETPVQFLGREDPMERGRLPTPVFMGFPGGSDGKESSCNVGVLGSILG